MATVAAGASVLALAVPQAAQAAQEAFMMAEVRCSACCSPFCVCLAIAPPSQ